MISGILFTIVISTAAAAVGTVAFALLFGVPCRFFSYCGVLATGQVGCVIMCIY